jgi:hypothetical protein
MRIKDRRNKARCCIALICLVNEEDERMSKISVSEALPRLVLEDSLLSLKLSSAASALNRRIEARRQPYSLWALTSSGRAVLPLPCHFAPVTTSRLLWNRKRLVTGVAWRGITRRRVTSPPGDFSSLHRRRSSSRS